MHTLLIALALCTSSDALPQPEAPKPAPTQPVPAPPAADKSKLYDVNADAKQQIAAAVAKAKRLNRRVLIQWGGNWCSWCIKLNDLMISDFSLSGELRNEYVVVHVDAGQPKDKNIDLATSYGADLKANGFPFLTVLDGNGKPVANQETSSLERKDAKGESVLGERVGHDPAKVLAFLKKHEATPLDAQKVLTAAFAEAQSSGKLVFLHMGISTSILCDRLDDWMAAPPQSAILGKGFIPLNIDVERMTGGRDMFFKYGSKFGTSPIIVFLDHNGKVVADGLSPDGTSIEFPQTKKHLAHFEEMLAKAVRLSDEDRAKLIESLSEKKPAAAGGSR